MKYINAFFEGRMLVFLTGLYIVLSITSLAYFIYLIINFTELNLFLFVLHATILVLLIIPVMLGFNQILIRLANFHDITFHIHFLIWSSLVFWLIISIFAIGYILGYVPAWVAIISCLIVIAIFYLIPPILLIIIGAKLKECPNNLFGLLKPIRLSFLWTGIIYLTFLLGELAFAVSYFNDILLLMLYYKLYWADTQIEHQKPQRFTKATVFSAFFAAIVLYIVSYTIIIFVPMDKLHLNSDEDELNEIVLEEIQRIQSKGVENQDNLQEKYYQSCQKHANYVKQGKQSDICNEAVKELLEETLRSNLSAYDAVELAVTVCKRLAEDDEEYMESCANDADWYEWMIFRDAISFALCKFENAWIITEQYETSITKRGRNVYHDQELAVSCNTHELQAMEYYGFFSKSLVHETEYEKVEEEEDDDDDDKYESRFMEAYYHGRDELTRFIGEYAFGVDENADKEILDVLSDNDEYYDLLITAIKKRDKSVNFDIDYYSQPLMHAIESGNNKGSIALLNAGANPSIPGKYGVPPLSKALTNCSIEVVRLLVKKGADVNGVIGSETLNYAEPLKIAAYSGNREAVKYLLKSGANLLPETAEKYPNFNPSKLLYYASIAGDMEIFNSFLNSGASLPSDEQYVMELLTAIIQGSSPAILKQVFSLGLQMPEKLQHKKLYQEVEKNITDEENTQIDKGLDLLDILISNGLDMSITEDNGWHFGHQAIINYAPTKILFSHVNDDTRYVKQTAFVLRVIQEVLKNGIDVNATYKKQRTMLMGAAGNASYEVVNYLLSSNAKQNLRDENGDTALDIAINNGRRMMKHWQDKQKLRESYKKTILALGGDPNVLYTAPAN